MNAHSEDRQPPWLRVPLLLPGILYTRWNAEARAQFPLELPTV